MIALPWKKLCANFILPCGENHYGFFLRCPTSFYNQPDILMLKYDNKFTVVQIAQALNMDAQVVKKRLQRIRARLKSALEEKGYDTI